MLRKQKRQDIFKRRTAAGQERMRIISQLARKEKGNDDFGLRDEDWDIYKTISKDGEFIHFSVFGLGSSGIIGNTKIILKFSKTLLKKLCHFQWLLKLEF